MNIIIIIISVIGGIIGFLLLVGLFSRKSYAMKRDVIINKPKSEVFNYIRHIKNQDHFNKWVMMDLNMKKSYRGTDGTVGFVYAWDGNKKAGKGEQEIKNIIEGERLDLEVRFERPFVNTAKTPFTIEAAPGGTKVIWAMSSSMKYPMNIMLLLVPPFGQRRCCCRHFRL